MPSCVRLILFLFVPIVGMTSASWAQPRLFTPLLEVGGGWTALRWEGDVRRSSYLPTTTTAFVARLALPEGLAVDLVTGLQLDATGFKAPRSGYADHYTILAGRLGLFVLGLDAQASSPRQMVAGIGLEARPPLLTRARAFSLGPQGAGRAWVPLPDPPHPRWGLYWVLRWGVLQGRQALYVDVTYDNESHLLPQAWLPSRRLEYVGLRLTVQQAL